MTPFLHRIIVRLHRLHAGTLLVTGIAALGYGLLELVVAYLAWMLRRRCGREAAQL